FRLYRIDRVDLFPASHHPRVARVCHAAAGDRDAGAGVPAPVGSTSPAWALDDADLALCFGHRRARLFHPLSLVPAAESFTRSAVDVCSGTQRQGKMSL